MSEGFVDYVRTRTSFQQHGDWDQSNWIALYKEDGWTTNDADLAGYKLKDVTGTYSGGSNPTLTITAAPQKFAQEKNKYTPNEYIICNFGGMEQTNVKDIKYFFVQPKPLEYASVNWAWWDGEKFIVYPENGENLDGSFYINDSYYEGGTMPSLEKDRMYNFTAIIKRETASASTLKATGSQQMVVYPISGLSTPLPTSITAPVENLPVETGRYNLAGQAVGNDARGIIIIKMSDGSVKKIMK